MVRCGNPEILNLLGMPVIVASPAIHRALDLVRRVAQTSAAVLIGGESGSGKEIIARAVHHYSLRSHKPWVDLSCAALPEHLMESELFGYEKGAFSGADGCKPGLFELAHQGTLFLDEVGELDPRMQVKLLRVLDGTPYYRLGGLRKVSVDVRIVAATNRDLEELVDAGKFRADLYHRLSQIMIDVPPLRERPEDIEALAAHFAAQIRPGLVLAQDALDELTSRSWPGNIRELRNAVTRAAVVAQGDVLYAADFPQRSTAHAPCAKTVPIDRRAPDPAADTSLAGLERRTILEVLSQTNGHQQRAADLLGISRRTLSRKLKLYALESMRHESFAS